MGSAESLRETSNPRGRVLLAALLALAGVGMGVAVELTRIHYYTHTDPSFHSVCAINERVNCETVAQSPYSIFMGLPISVWGLLAYGLFGALAIWGLIPRRLHPAWPRGALLLFSAGTLACSALLAYISFFRIDSMCLFCMSLYLTNALLFAVSVAMLVRGRLNPLRAVVDDLIAFARRPLAAAATLTLAIGAVAGAQLLVSPYWIHVKLADLPSLPTGEQEGGGHWIGALDPLVTVTEFSDFQCPFCRTAYNNARSWAAEYPTEVRFVHRHQPLDSSCNPSLKRKMHPLACEFAEASECAWEQGHFWQMSDALFSVQEMVRAGDVDLELLAVQIGIDLPRFRECMESGRVMRHIRADIKEAKARGIRGTPTFYINSQPYVGGFPRSTLANAVESARARAAAKN
jgi:protein-disulfide isomerase/uncharacterized membrane protein